MDSETEREFRLPANRFKGESADDGDVDFVVRLKTVSCFFFYRSFIVLFFCLSIHLLHMYQNY